MRRAVDVLERQYLEMRERILSLAADFDRIEGAKREDTPAPVTATVAQAGDGAPSAGAISTEPRRHPGRSEAEIRDPCRSISDRGSGMDPGSPCGRPG